jgi:ribonuclease R
LSFFHVVSSDQSDFGNGRAEYLVHKYGHQYDAVQKTIFDSLLKLYEVTKKLKKKRLEKGFDFRSDEFRLNLDKDQKLTATSLETSSPSHSLIEECMLLANVEASKRLGNLGIFRVHDEPTPNAIQKLLDEAYYLGIKAKNKADIHSTITGLQKKAKNTPYVKQIDEMIIHAQIQARYSEKKASHFGLGFESYSHFTSPIRRYADLVLHRILKEDKTPNDIEGICQDISTTERRINELVWDFEDRKYARWGYDNIGKVISCEIVDTERNLAESINEILGIRVNLLNYKGEKIYSKVNVKIDSVNLLEKRVFGYITKK